MLSKFVGSLILLAAFTKGIEVRRHNLLPVYQTVHAIQKSPVLIKSQPLIYQPIHVQESLQKEENNGPVEYSYSYEVNDKKTGDIKSAKESRKDDRVEGSYELIDSDGYRRLVLYTADDHNGFQAVVHREPTDIKIPLPEPKEVQKLVLSEPKVLLNRKTLTPIVHYSPVVQLKKSISLIRHDNENSQQYQIQSQHIDNRSQDDSEAEQNEEEVEEKSSDGSNHVSFSGPGISYKY